MMQQQSAAVLPLELYTTSKILNGEVLCPIGVRLLEVLNGVANVVRHVKSDFIAFSDTTTEHDVDIYQNQPTHYVRKSSVRFVTVSDADAARGLGASRDQKVYPYVNKTAVEVVLDLPPYTIIGSIHCRPGQTVQDVLDDEREFLPLTSVTIVQENHIYGTRPFVAVNKQQIESLRQD